MGELLDGWQMSWNSGLKFKCKLAWNFASGSSWYFNWNEGAYNFGVLLCCLFHSDPEFPEHGREPARPEHGDTKDSTLPKQCD